MRKTQSNSDIRSRTMLAQHQRSKSLQALPTSCSHLFEESDSSSIHDDDAISTTNSSGTEVRYRFLLPPNINGLPRNNRTYFYHSSGDYFGDDPPSGNQRGNVAGLEESSIEYQFKKNTNKDDQYVPKVHSTRTSVHDAHVPWCGDPSKASPEYIQMVFERGNAFRDSPRTSREQNASHEAYEIDSGALPPFQHVLWLSVERKRNSESIRSSRTEYMRSTHATRPTQSLIEDGNIPNLCLHDKPQRSTQRNSSRTTESNWESEKSSTPRNLSQFGPYPLSKYEMKEVPSTSSHCRFQDITTLEALTGKCYSLGSGYRIPTSSSTHEQSVSASPSHRHPMAESNDMRQRHGELVIPYNGVIHMSPVISGLRISPELSHRRNHASLPGFNSGQYVTQLRGPTPPAEEAEIHTRLPATPKKSLLRRIFCA